MCGVGWIGRLEWLCLLVVVVVFFFKQKTAYEMLRSLVGSEMCIRDRLSRYPFAVTGRRK